MWFLCFPHIPEALARVSNGKTGRKKTQTHTNTREISHAEHNIINITTFVDDRKINIPFKILLNFIQLAFKLEEKKKLANFIILLLKPRLKRLEFSDDAENQSTCYEWEATTSPNAEEVKNCWNANNEN